MIPQARGGAVRIPISIHMTILTLRRAAALIAFSSLAHAGALTAQDFEGVITIRSAVRSRDGSPAPDVEYMTRAGKLRINVRSPMGTMGVIALPAEKKMFVLMDAQSAYMEQPLSFSGRESTMPAPSIMRTGKKEMIAGHECEHVLVVGKPDTTDVCVARGLGPYIAPSLGAQMPAWQRALTADGAFPLRVAKTDGTVQMEVTKIEKRKLSPAMFDVPDSYTKMVMPAVRRPPG